MPSSFRDLDQLCVNTIRGLTMDAVQAANSGHPGMPMGCAPMAHVLWTRHLRHHPGNPHWFNRDRFILSAGHGSMLLYALLHLTGYDLPLEEIKRFRQFGSMTPGHPENHLTPGVEMATGPLGQGISTAVGMAIAEAHLAAVFNREGFPLVDHFTFGICSDGDLMEGVAQEASSLAGHLKLGKLIFLYDDNDVTIDGPTSLAYTENPTLKFQALGWQVLECDGMDMGAVDQALTAAKLNLEQPTLIRAKTVIGYGSPNRAGLSKAHGEPLGPEELKLAKEALGIPLEPAFWIPEEALVEYRQAVPRGEDLQAEWDRLCRDYAEAYPDEANRFFRALAGDVSLAVDAIAPIGEKLATRASSGKVVNQIAPHLDGFLGGGADLTGNINVVQTGLGVFSPENRAGRTIHYGVREHAMAAAMNGITIHGGCRAFGGTFLIFSDYCKPSVRLAALMQVPTIFVFTHDSIGLGEDGPTHQPIEQIAGLRAIPNLNMIRPADGNEVAAAWRMALEATDRPTALILSRQALPVVSPDYDQDHPALRGGYILRESENPKATLIATGSEVHLALAVAERLGEGFRVVSLPCWSVFETQDRRYRHEVLRPDLPSISIEAAATLGWERYADLPIGLDRFGASAPGDVNFRELGFSVEALVERIQVFLEAN